MKLIPEMLKKEQIVVVLLAGILLLIIAMPVKKKDTEEQTVQSAPSSETSQKTNYEDRLQQRLKEVLAEVKGIGKTDVFVTFEDTGERVVEKDGTDTVYSKDSKGNQEPYLSNERYPKISGVVVVAEGGEDPHVIQNIQEAVQALFQVEAHKIKVMKMVTGR